MLALIAGDDALALVENKLMQAEGARDKPFHAAMLAAMMKATKEESEKWQKYKRAKDSGVEEAALAAKFGEPPPVHVSADAPRYSWGRGNRPDYVAAVNANDYTTTLGNVRNVAKKGDRATINFADRVSKGRRPRSTKIDPITVPASEVARCDPAKRWLRW